MKEEDKLLLKRLMDIDRMADEKGATFDIIGKYFDYSKSIGESYKTIGDFSGSVEIADETTPIAIKFDGKMDAVSSDKCEEANVKLNMDLSDIKKQAGVEEMEASDKEIFETIMKARPTAFKGTYLKKISMSSTMGVGVKVDSSNL